MTARKPASRRTSGSDLARVDAHVIRRREYEALPELTEDMLVRGKANKGNQSGLAGANGEPPSKAQPK